MEPRERALQLIALATRSTNEGEATNAARALAKHMAEHPELLAVNGSQGDDDEEDDDHGLSDLERIVDAVGTGVLESLLRARPQQYKVKVKP